MSQNVLFVTSTFPRWQGDATGPFVLELAKAVAARGWIPVVLAPHGAGCVSQERLEGIEVHRFRYSWPARTESLCYGGGALNNLRRNPANYLLLPAFIGAQAHAIRRLLSQREFSVLHSHWILPQSFVASAINKGRIAHVATAHGSDAFGLNGSMLHLLKRYALSGADAISVNSQATRRALAGLLRDSTKIEIVPIGATEDLPDDTQLESRRRALRAQHEAAPLLLFVGRLVQEKGVADFLSAIASLKSRLPRARAIIIGDGPERSGLEHMAARLEIAGSVQFLGRLPNRVVRDYLAAADIFVAPSVRSHFGGTEAQGVSIAEAMLAGLPVIATNIGGIVDHIFDGETGLLVDEHSPNQIADAILHIYETPGQADAIGHRARSHAEQQLNMRSTAERFCEIYERVTAFRDSRSANS